MPARITRHKAQRRALARATSVYRRLSAFIVTSIIVDGSALGYRVESESKLIPLPFSRTPRHRIRSRGTFFIAGGFTPARSCDARDDRAPGYSC